MFTKEEIAMLKELVEIEIDEIGRLIDKADDPLDVEALEEHKEKLNIIYNKLNH